MKLKYIAVGVLAITALAQGAALKNIINSAEATIKKKDKTVEKFKSYYNVLNRWMDIKNEGRSLNDYFKANGIKTIAVYGMGELGIHICNELKDSDTLVAFAIDKDINTDNMIVPIKKTDEELPLADAVVVTPIFAFDKIKADLENKVSGQILSLEDIIYSL